MPKANRNHSQTKGAALARERREREKKESQYNDALKDFLHVKYSHIIAEFESLYENIMARRPRHLVYTNTREFRMWRRREIHNEIQPVEPQHVEQPIEQPRQQVEQPTGLLQIEQPIEQPGQQVEQPTGLLQIEQPSEQPRQQVEQPNGLLQIDQLGNLLLQDEQLNELLRQVELPIERLQDVPDPIVNEIEVRTDNADEGISLDAWEELQDDIREFDYRMEVELEQYLQ